ncbi:MAG: hypothetical protein H0W45_11705 [Acidobacteria bacterium]|jgi:hypothetical protein|nr:hypothetical protein [Acidobacteriota bacterium]
MRKAVRNLLLVSLFFFVLAFGGCWVGVSYDERNKLYPEPNWIGYDVSIGKVYGKRWERIGNTLLSVGLVIGSIAIVIYYREKQIEDKSIIDLVREE